MPRKLLGSDRRLIVFDVGKVRPERTDECQRARERDRRVDADQARRLSREVFGRRFEHVAISPGAPEPVDVGIRGRRLGHAHELDVVEDGPARRIAVDRRALIVIAAIRVRNGIVGPRQQIALRRHAAREIDSPILRLGAADAHVRQWNRHHDAIPMRRRFRKGAPRRLITG